MISVHVSILGGSQDDLVKTAMFAQDNKASVIHVDVMDGKFVIPTHYSPKVVSELSSKIDLPIETHLIVVGPSRLVEEYVRAGAKLITVHVESQPNQELLPLIEKIQSSGVKAGIALNPKTSMNEIDPLALSITDYVMVMSVEPGYSGQKFIESTLEKITLLKQRINSVKSTAWISVDGGVNLETATKAIQAGANALVVGAAFYNHNNPHKFIEELSLL